MGRIVGRLAALAACALIAACTGTAAPPATPPSSTAGPSVPPATTTAAPTESIPAPSSAAPGALIACTIFSQAEVEALAGHELIQTWVPTDGAGTGCHWQFDQPSTCQQSVCPTNDQRWDLEVRSTDGHGKEQLANDLTNDPACASAGQYSCSKPVAELQPDAWDTSNGLEVVRGDRLFIVTFTSFGGNDVQTSIAVLRAAFGKLGIA